MSREINILWEGPFKLNELISLNDESKDYGIYQIYGGHPVYGTNVLLYIGKAAKQTFCERINQEGWDGNKNAKSLNIYIGRMTGKTPTNELWCKEIGIAEKLLIYAHEPAFNSQNIKFIPEDDVKDIHIFNWGCYCDLMPEVSGKRWTRDLYDDVYCNE